MFSYFGSKSKIIGLYPRALYDRVIEPFCGSARYALRFYDRDVWINDKYEVIYTIWKWIQQANKADIRALPKLKKGESLDDCKQLSRPEKLLCGFLITQGAAAPIKTLGGWSARGDSLGRGKAMMLRYVGRIDHWRITNRSYDEMGNLEGSWYIDPPYQQMGHCYKHNKIDYAALAKWCLSRRGQVMVCEGGSADWLPFKPMRECNRIKRDDTYKELFWYRSDRKRGFGLF